MNVCVNPSGGFAAMDLILRSARIAGRPGGAPVDIGIDKGRIAAIEPRLAADGRELDLGGRLVSPGFIETHIHLDKSGILDRCKAEKGDLEEAIGEVARAKKAFTPGGRLHARQTHAREEHPQRHHAHAHPARGRSGHRAARAHRRAAADRRIQVGDRHRDLHLPAGRPAQQSGHRRADGRGAQARRQGGRRGALYRHQSQGPDGPGVRAGARVRHRHRHASRFRPERR